MPEADGLGHPVEEFSGAGLGARRTQRGGPARRPGRPLLSACYGRLHPVDEELQRKLYDLNSTTGLDNPANNGFFAPFHEFRRAVLHAPWFRPDGQILAADAEQWVGLAGVAFFPEARYAYNGFTGVRPAYRGRGLAQALKLLAIRWAGQQGARCIRTSNDSRNAPMLAINKKLGYRPEPGLYYLVRGLDRRNHG